MPLLLKLAGAGLSELAAVFLLSLFVAVLEMVEVGAGVMVALVN